MKKGFVAGNFDVIHPGYIKMFTECKTNCDHFTILLHSDPSMERAEKLKLPDICDILVSADETRHHWYKEIEMREKSKLEKQAEEDILTRQRILRKKEQEMHDIEKDLDTKAESISQQEQESIAKYIDLIDEYRIVFEDTNGRAPTKIEILKHFDGIIKKEFMEEHVPDDADNNVIFFVSSIICAEIFFEDLEMLSLNLSFEATLLTLLLTLNLFLSIVLNLIIFSYPLFLRYTGLFPLSLFLYMALVV